MNCRRPMIRRLRNMLQTPDPAVRKQAVTMLSSLRNPNALWILRNVAQNDMDTEVRTLAQQAINQRLATMQANLGTQGITAQEIHWDCVFCGTRDIQGAACPNCGAPRPTEADEKAAATADSNVPVPNPFMGGNGGMGGMMPMRGMRGGWGQRRNANGGAFIFMLIVLFMFALMFMVLYGSVGHRFFLR